MTEALRNPILAGLFGAIVTVAVLFAVGFLLQLLRSRLARPFRLTGTDKVMPLSDDQLIAALRETVRKLRKRRFFRPAIEDICIPRQVPYPPASELSITAAESRMRRRLPPLLRRIYLEVANGEFGPGYGLIGVEGGATDSLGRDVSTAYESRLLASDDTWEWPAQLLPLIELGCGEFLCVDLDIAALPVVSVRPVEDVDLAEEEPDRLEIQPIAHSLNHLLAQWVQGVRTFSDQNA